MENLADIVTPFIHSEDTCKDVEEHFANLKHTPIGSYGDLANYFINDDKKHTRCDECYKNWLNDLISSGKERESIILNCLKKEYKTKEALRKFVFSLNGLSPEYNQKWHFFISYWGYREYVTKYPNNNFDKITPLNQYFEAINQNPFKRCTEGKLWYTYMKEKMIKKAL